MVLSILISSALLAATLALWYTWRKRRMSYFARLGIPGPTPDLISGNLKEIGKKGTFQCHKEWFQKYGKLVGYYFGGEPVLLVADPDLLKTVQVKEFQDFPGRKSILAGSFLPDKLVLESMPLISGPRWKRSRNVLSPIFSASRLKWMSKMIDDSLKLTSDLIKQKADEREPFDMYQTLQGSILDIVTRTTFGVRTTCQNNRNDPFLQNMLEANSYQVKGPLMVFTACFPELGSLSVMMRNLKDAVKYYTNKPSTQGMFRQCLDMLNARKDDKQVRQPDLLQLMIDEKETLRKLYGKAGGSTDAAGPERDNEMLMTQDEMVSNAAVMMLAAYETISLTLAFTFRFLVHHQDIQDKAREEAKKVLGSEGSLDYAAAGKLQYIEQVMSETLRLCPVVNGFIFREAVNDFSYGDLVIPKGTVLQASLEELHRSEEFWEDPLKFDPERFAPENLPAINPYVYQPFGNGPRHCVGKRFAQMTIKMAIARLLLDYRFLVCDKTHPPEGGVAYKIFQFFPKDGVHLQAVPLQETN